MRDVLAQLGLQRERQLDVSQARLGLGLADTESAAMEVEPRPRRAGQLGDPRTGEAERREQRAAPVLLMLWEARLPLAGAGARAARRRNGSLRARPHGHAPTRR